LAHNSPAAGGGWTMGPHGPLPPRSRQWLHRQTAGLFLLPEYLDWIGMCLLYREIFYRNYHAYVLLFRSFIVT